MMSDLHVPLHDNTKFFVNSGIMKQVGLSNLFTKEMKIHPNMVGLIIGRKGAMIRKLEKLSGASLEVETDDTGEKTLIIMGNLESVCLAEMLVIEEIKKANKTQPAEIIRLPEPQGPDIVTEKFPIPVDKCGMIIGKRGVTIKKIQVISKCHIELYRQQEPNANELLIIKGPRKQIPYAKKLITKKIKFGNFGYEEYAPSKQLDQEDESSDSDSPSPPPVIKSHQSKVNGLDKSKSNTPLTRSMSSVIKSPFNDPSNTTVVSSIPLIASKATAKSSSLNNLSCVQPSSTVVKSKPGTGPITRSQYRATNDQLEVAIRANTPSSMSGSYLINNKSRPPASLVMKSKSKIDKSKVSLTMPIKNKVSKSKTSSEEQIKEKDYQDGFDDDKDEEEEERFVAESEEEKELDAEKDEERFDNGEEEEDVSDSDYDDDSRYDRIPIQRKKNFTPNVRRTRRPHINTLGCGDYIEYVDHWGGTPSNQIGREAKYIMQRKNKEEVRHRSKGNVVINEQEE